MDVIIPIVAGIAAALLIQACTGAKTPDLGDIERRTIVDVRTGAEFSSGHIPGALHIPVGEIGVRAAEIGEKNTPILVYCRSGNRSGQAKKTLEGLGYTDVVNGGGVNSLAKRMGVGLE